MTDEEILKIIESNQEATKQIVCKSRGSYAYVYYTVVSLAVMVSYACMFFTFQYSTTPTDSNPSVTVNFIESQ